MSSKLDKSKMRTGFTTGACAAAAARAATYCLLNQSQLSEIEIEIPNRSQVTFKLSRCELSADSVRCGVIKDAGDDPDCTHGAEIIAEVSWKAEPGVTLQGGEGVAMVTRPGLGLTVGGPAINPVPRKNITENVTRVLGDKGVLVVIHVPGGEEMAKETINERLGLIGGISILGTTGIVRPYSTAAFRTSVVQAIDVASEEGCKSVVLTTGGKSEMYAMKLLPELPELVFIQVGDFIGTALKHAVRRNMDIAFIVGMIGKLSKMADGKMMTHASGSKVNMDMLADIVGDVGGSPEVLAEIREAATARRVMELCQEHGIKGAHEAICRKTAEECKGYAGGNMTVSVYMMDFEGAVLGRFAVDRGYNYERKRHASDDGSWAKDRK